MDEMEVRKKLCWMLRCKPEKGKEDIIIDIDGYADLDKIVKHWLFWKKYNVDDIKTVVNNDERRRFTIRTHPTTNILQIKANYGHFIPIRMDEFEPLTDVNTIIVYGTYEIHWKTIRRVGISRKDRTHIHFDMYNAIMRNSDGAQIHIYVNLKKALSDGIKFYKTTNDIVLSPGNDDGILDKIYFSDVIHVPTSTHIQF